MYGPAVAGHVSAGEAAALRRALAQREDELARTRRGLGGAPDQVLQPPAQPQGHF